MQDITSKMSDTDIKPMVDPSPLQGTTVTIANGGTPPLDDTTYDLQLRVDTHPENLKLRHIINEPGPNNQDIYNHIMRELLKHCTGWYNNAFLGTKCSTNGRYL